VFIGDMNERSVKLPYHVDFEFVKCLSKRIRALGQGRPPDVIAPVLELLARLVYAGLKKSQTN
jgi:hypothetical protein